MLSRNKDLFLADLLIFACMLLPFLNSANSTLRLVLGLPLVFFLPGYCFTEAFFVKNRLELAEHWVMNLGISIGLTMLVGFILNQSSWGLQYISWALLLGSLSFVFAQIALLRRFLTVRKETKGPISQPGVQITSLSILFLTASVLLIIWTFTFAQFSVASSSSPFTQFWMLPATNDPNATSAPGLPSNGAAGQNAQTAILNVGIRSMEKEPTQYSVVVKLNNQVLHQWQAITLQPGQTWQEQITFGLAPNQTGPVQAFLYKSDTSGEVYRMVTWWPTTTNK